MELNKNTIIITIISFVGIFAFLTGAYMLTNKAETTVFEEVNKILPSDHLKWSPEKKNILVEYSDFQCPACKNYHEIISQQIEASGSANFDITKKVTFVYRNFPLFQIHQHAYAAASAAEAAGKQNKFFEMGDALFNTQDEWSKSSNVQAEFIKIATNLKLDIEKFKKDMGSKDIKDKVDTDMRSGEKAGLDSTPTFYLNGKKVTVTSFEEFIKVLKSVQ
ncbi:MAG: thioredoxin domain-containing protein [bacterium]|nr:thioredoxin domain-containing protein [bacterium]